jgi:UDP-N-acetylglucosamine pyrophosphorylase
VLVEVEKTCKFSFTSPILFFVLRSLKVSTLSQVWFLEEEKIPVVSSSEEEGKRHKIMMKSPWEILQSPVGSGGVISLLSSVNIPENLSKMGVEYIEVRRVLSILFVWLI